jgi:O-antigen/teichoic acid export membrane protein
LLSRSILSNYLGSLFGLVISRGLRFAGVAYCLHRVGDYTWGQSVSTIALLAFLTFIVDQGLSSAPLLFHLRSRVADRQLLKLITGYRVAMATIFILCIHGISRWIHPLDPLFLVYALVLFPRSLSIDWWFHRRELYQFTTYITTVRTMSFFGAVLIFIHEGASAKSLLYVEMLSETISIGFSFYLMRFAPRSEEQGEPVFFGIRKLLIFSFPFLLIAVLNNVQVSMDILLLKFLLGNAVTAQYDVGIKVSFLYFFVGAAFVQIVRPKLTRLSQERNLEKLGLILRTTSSLLLLASAVFLIPCLYFAEWFVAFLFDRRAGLSVFVFQWSALWVGISFMTMLGSDTLLSIGKRKFYFIAACICAAVNIGGNFLFLKFFGGYGAIVAKILSEAVFLAAALSFLPGEVRKTFSVSLIMQFVVLFLLISTYLGTSALGMPLVGLLLSVIGVSLLFWRSRVFSADTLAVLKNN